MAQQSKTAKGGKAKNAAPQANGEHGIDPRKQAALDTALKQVEKDFGKGSAMRLGDKPVQNVEVIPTGSLALDMALGIGGLPRGRIVEIYGPESSGKTTLALHAVANAQKAGGVAAYIDAEHALDPVYAKKLGVDTDQLIISQPDNGEQALEIADMLVRSGALDVVVIDSVAALVPKAEIEGEMGDSHVGLQARLMSQALRKMTGALAQSNTTAIFINQLREKIGVFFGSPETTTGGKALKFYASVRLDIRRIQTLKNGDEAVGNRTKVKVVKNKMAPPFKFAEFDILYGEGISREGSVLDMAIQCDVVKKSGSWFTYEGDQLGQGRENVRQFLKDNPALTDEIERKVKIKYGLIPDDSKPDDDGDGKDADSQQDSGSSRADAGAGASEVGGASSTPDSAPKA
ncbi:recombinase RecA [Bifidobacterium sp. ESL0798]|uniref:recombinase RecA n=1 Tax=Bifidobacterium sp. ESL0798 TaxID=2983235 RepID=UPI0023F8BA79|nr:recombinase RecA [Bifidobacterium sp. ESL0798]WEV73499.1 recombinase RecA [Bifidobacterium sp. ESL0798]